MCVCIDKQAKKSFIVQFEMDQLHGTPETKGSSPMFTFSRQPTPQPSDENLRVAEATTELRRLVAQYGFPVVSMAWEWFLVDHQMETGDPLIDPSRSLTTPPSPLQLPLSLPLPASAFASPTMQQQQQAMARSFSFTPEPFSVRRDDNDSMHMSNERRTPVVEFRFVVATDDDDDEEEDKV